MNSPETEDAQPNAPHGQQEAEPRVGMEKETERSRRSPPEPRRRRRRCPARNPSPRLRIASKRERPCAADLAGWKEEAEHLPCAREDDGGDPAG